MSKRTLFHFRKVKRKTDIDLSCVMTDGQGRLCDHVYSPLYRNEFLERFGLPQGKIDSNAHALHHCGDDVLTAPRVATPDTDREIITANLAMVPANVKRIYFFVNVSTRIDFSEIPSLDIHIYKGSSPAAERMLANIHICGSTEYRGCYAIIACYLERDADNAAQWTLHCVATPTADDNLCHTIHRIALLAADDAADSQPSAQSADMVSI